MTRAEQNIHARMLEIRDMVESGATESVGKTYRGADDKIAGRHRGGMSKMFPELARAGVTPGQAAEAINRGRGRVYDRLYRTMVRMYGSGHHRGRGRLTVEPHKAITRKCRHCEELHSASEHRFHGSGSYHETHLFSFNPRMTKNKCGLRQNPVIQTVIYGKVLAIEAQKTQKHVCDDECKQYGHRYRHDFTTPVVMYGLSDGSILLKPK